MMILTVDQYTLTLSFTAPSLPTYIIIHTYIHTYTGPLRGGQVHPHALPLRHHRYGDTYDPRSPRTYIIIIIGSSSQPTYIVIIIHRHHAS